MELGQGIRRLKVLVEKLSSSEILAPDPDVLERIIEMFHIVKELEEPTLVDSVDMMQFTEDGEEPKA
tara:strand:- start:338 stop:538 length:201 start_codon:yes stop_codon:yes gene_type:complete